MTQPSRAAPVAIVLTLLIIALALIVGALLVAVVAYDRAMRGRVVQGVVVDGVNVGGRGRAEFDRLLLAAFERDARSPVELFVDETATRSTAGELGLQLDLDATWRAAFAIGRRGDRLEQTRDRVRTFRTGASLAAARRVDDTRAAAALARLAAATARAPVDAALRLLDDGQVELRPAAPGRHLLETEARDLLAARLLAGDAFSIPLPVARVAPRLDEREIDPSRERATSLIAPLVLEGAGREWLILSRDLARLVRLEGFDGEPPRLAFDHQCVTALVERIAREIDHASADADLVLIDGAVRVVPERAGSRLDRGTTIARIVDRRGGAYERVRLAVDSLTPRRTAADLAPLADSAAALTETPLVARLADQTFPVPSDTLRTALRLERAPTGVPTRVFLAREPLLAAVAAWRELVDRPPTDARFRFRASRLEVETPDTPGVALLVEETTDALLAAARTNRRAAVRAARIPAAVRAEMSETIALPDIITEARTSYAGSLPDRAYNVELATSRLDGVVLAPGEEFSFNARLGPQTIGNGFRLGYGIALSGTQALTIPSEAGGICQVATTLFQATFWSGLELLERNTHLYWIPRYGQPPTGFKGLDATVDDQYGVDFRFVNTSGSWLAIAARADGAVVRFALHGTRPDWVVTVSPPVEANLRKAVAAVVEQPDATLPEGRRVAIEQATDGFDVTLERVVSRAGQTIDRWRATTTYLPSRNVVLVGTAKTPAASAAGGAALRRQAQRPPTPPPARPRREATATPRTVPIGAPERRLYIIRRTTTEERCTARARSPTDCASSPPTRRTPAR